MSRRYRVMPLRAHDGSPAAWGVFLRSRGVMDPVANIFTGPFAWYQARFRAAALNRRGWQ